MTELLPCPICGHDAELVEGWYVYCPNRSCWVDGTALEDTDAEAVEAWNNSVERTCRNVNKEWEKTSFAHAGTSFCCSECGAHYVDCECYYAGLADADEQSIRTNYCPNCGAKVIP